MGVIHRRQSDAFRWQGVPLEDEVHQFENDGDEPLGFLCVVAARR